MRRLLLILPFYIPCVAACTGLRDPFHWQQPPRAHQTIKKNGFALKIVSKDHETGASCALIEASQKRCIVTVGDLIDQWKVTEINTINKSVTLENEKKTITISIN